jgi:hypothetical protein
VPLKIESMKTAPARKMMSANVPRSILLLLLLAAVAWMLNPFLLPGLRSYFEWALHRTTSFEDGSINIPIGWSKGEALHLLSLRKPHFFAYALPESTIVIDPFAERHQGHVEEAWQIWSHGWGRPVDVIAGARCAQRNFSPSIYEIDCLSPDSTVMFEFEGNQGELPAFRDIFRQATVIAEKHAGQIVRPAN